MEFSSGDEGFDGTGHYKKMRRYFITILGVFFHVQNKSRQKSELKFQQNDDYI